MQVTTTAWNRSAKTLPFRPSARFTRFAKLIPSPPHRQMRNALCYIMNNARRHGERLDPAYGGVDPFSSAWHFDGWSHDRWRRGLDPPPGEV